MFSTGRVKHVDLGYGGFAHVRESSSPVFLGAGGPYHEAALEEVTCRYKAIADMATSLGTGCYLRQPGKLPPGEPHGFAPRPRDRFAFFEF